MGMKWIFSLILLVSAVFIYSLFYSNQESAISNGMDPVMKIRSSAFENGGMIPVLYTCNGNGLIPPLLFEGVPKEARSMALIVDDPAAADGIFTHWAVWNIAPAAGGIAGGLPKGAKEGQNSSGRIGYYPPCPPRGEHKYYFRLYALDSMLNLQTGASRRDVEAAMRGKIVGIQAVLIGKYEPTFGG